MSRRVWTGKGGGCLRLLLHLQGGVGVRSARHRLQIPGSAKDIWKKKKENSPAEQFVDGTFQQDQKHLQKMFKIYKTWNCSCGGATAPPEPPWRAQLPLHWWNHRLLGETRISKHFCFKGSTEHDSWVPNPWRHCVTVNRNHRDKLRFGICRNNMYLRQF